MNGAQWDYLTESSKVANKVAGTLIWTVIAMIIAIAAGIMVYFMFVKDKKEVSKKLQTLKDLLDFKVMLIEPLLKVLYIISTIFVILLSFGLISTSFVSFLMCLIFGPISIRICYELVLIRVMTWKNTQDISESVKPKMAKKEKKMKKKSKSKDLFFCINKKRAFGSLVIFLNSFIAIKSC